MRLPLRRWTILAALSLGLPARSALAQCTFIDTGIPADSSNASGGVFLGEALGQTFQAEGLQIESITVWRVPWQAGYVYGIHIYVVPTDSLGEPSVANMLLDGPTVFNAGGDGIHPTPFEFVFDPPLGLPRLGLYEFAVQSDPCGGIWDILTVGGADYYPAGYAWVHSRSTGLDCPLRGNPAGYPNADLCFRVRYCDIPTPIQKATWGHLKVIYR